MKPEVIHPAIFFFVKHKEDLVGGTTAAKTSPPPYDRSGTAGTGALEEPGTKTLEEPGTRTPEKLGAGAPEELEPNDRLLQKSQDEVRTRKSAQQNKDK